MPDSTHSRWLLPLVALIVLAAWYFAARTPLDHPSPSEPTFDAQVTSTRVKHRLTTASGPVVLHALTYDSPSGATTIRWYDSDFEPTRPRDSAVVSMFIDGIRVASAIKGSFSGIYDDGEGDLAWYGNLKRGRHRIVVQLERANQAWGVPYTDPGELGVDELIVRSDRVHAS
jgi:hypothetical protein